MSAHTVATLVEAVHEQFLAADLSYGHGTDNAWDEAVALVLRITGAADEQQSLARAVSAAQAARCMSAAAQRISTRQPLAYVLGACRYMGFEFIVAPGVVVPRSPIGYLLSDGLQPWLPRRVDRIVDLCSGCGCLGIVAAHLFADAAVTLVELDAVALDVARRNVWAHGLQGRVEVIAADVTAASDIAAPFDLVISNPPYVDAPGMRALPAEFRAEPAAGLAAGDDGLMVMNAIIRQLPAWLSPGGLFVGEVGASAPAMLARYPELPLLWPDLPRGGEGVFLLEADALTSHTARDS